MASVARRFPQVLSLLAQNRISLSVAGLLAPHLKDETVERLLSDCERKSRREVEEFLVALKPRPVLEPGIRKRPEPRSSLDAPAGDTSLPSRLPSPRSPEKSSSLIQPAEPDVYNFRFSARKDFKEKLFRVAEVLGIEAPEKNLAKILERALDLTLERKDPQKKLERRLVRENAPASRSPRPDEVGGSNRGASTQAISASSPVPTGCAAAREPASRSSTRGPLRSSRATMSIFCGPTALVTIASAPSVLTAWTLSARRSMRRSVRGPLSPLNPVREKKAEFQRAGELIRSGDSCTGHLGAKGPIIVT